MIKKHVIPALVCLLVFSGLTACDYIDPNDIHEGSKVLVSKWDLDTSFLERDSVQSPLVLLEEYTGHWCGNCPDAARQAKKLDSAYAGKLHVMAIHAGFFAEPRNNPDGSFAADYRCQAGDDLDTKFKVSESVPKGLINRGRFGGNSVALLSSSSWDAKITEILARPASDFTLYLNPFFDDSLGQFYAISHLKMRNPVSTPLRVALYLLEDSIVDWQLDYKANPQLNPNYLHRHMLRDAFTPVGGSENPGAGPYPSGKIATGRWVCSLRNGINRMHCAVVAIVYREDNDEILQAVEMEIKDR
jgi:thiol-disulfide isomerase/thioredoxin